MKLILFPNPPIHRCVFTSDNGYQVAGFGALFCVCGKMQMYQVPE